VPLVDLPANTVDGYAAPSFRQSLELTRSVDVLGRRLIYDGFGPEHRVAGLFVAAGFETLVSVLPLGSAWMHEEWHRAALRRRGITSYNGVYDFDLLAETISVSHVSDEDLARFKREHPAEFVRAAAAGHESELHLVLALEKDAFVAGPQPYEILPLWLTLAQTVAYLNVSAGSGGDELTDELDAEDGADVARRDWVGLDFTAWTYDLFRPDEPYEARGTHPSGVGIDRYRTTRDLTPEERDFLRKQARLSFLSFLDPQLVGRARFGGRGADAWRWNVALRHQLTSFGYAVDGHVFLGKRQNDVLVTVHSYFNHDRYFPGVEVALLRRPLLVAGRTLELSALAALWLQPEAQRFRTREARTGGLVSLDVQLGGRGVRPYVAVVAKSAGWVAGNVFLEKNLSVAAGLRLSGR
jgi:hypothetical protein